MRSPGAIFCSERSDLGKTLAETIRRLYTITAELDRARRGTPDLETIGALRASLQACREEELKAERAYREHVDAHGCTAETRSASGSVAAARASTLRS